METVSIEHNVTAPNLRSLMEGCFKIKDHDTMLRSLDFVMGQNMLDGALSILQPATGGPKICLMQCQGRTIRMVKGNQHNQFYLCILNEDCEYCSCRSFIERCRKNEPYCKHLLALKLFALLGMDEKEAVRVESFPNEMVFSSAVSERLFKSQTTS